MTAKNKIRISVSCIILITWVGVFLSWFVPLMQTENKKQDLHDKIYIISWAIDAKQKNIAANSRIWNDYEKEQERLKVVNESLRKEVASLEQEADNLKYDYNVLVGFTSAWQPQQSLSQTILTGGWL